VTKVCVMSAEAEAEADADADADAEGFYDVYRGR
jgi:hypothetical protein